MNTLISQHFIIMGVSGCGKSTIGSLLSEDIRFLFYDADDFHSSENLKKMISGIPLTDDDRKDWLLKLQQHLHEMSRRGISTVLACSALKEAYRNTLAEVVSFSDVSTHVEFIWLDVPYEVALKRVKKRTRHYMSPKLVQSQFDTLEVPTESEAYPIHRIDARSKDLESIVDACRESIR